MKIKALLFQRLRLRGFTGVFYENSDVKEAQIIF
jgi:hypothetical protein